MTRKFAPPKHVGLRLSALAFAGLTTNALVTNVAADASTPSEPSEHDNLPPTVSFYWENDGSVLRPGGTDRHATNGEGFSVSWASASAGDLFETFGLADQQIQANLGVVVGQRMYTPADLERVPPDPADWPYAGHLFAGMYAQQQFTNPAPGFQSGMDHVQFDIGLVGRKSMAGELQDWIHDRFSNVRPQGWDYQLRTEPTFQFTHRRVWRANLWAADGDQQAWLSDDTATIQPSPQGWAAQAMPWVETRLGTVHVDIAAGATLRAGFNLPDNYGVGTLARPIANFDALPNPGWSVYGFGDASLRAVAHNLFLDGGTFRDGPSVDKEPLVGRLTGGVAVAYRFENGNEIALNHSLWWETSQVQSQSERDSGGQLTLVLNCRF